MAIYNTGEIRNNGGTSLNSGSHDLSNNPSVNILNLRATVKNKPFGSTVVDGINVTGSHSSLVEVPRDNPKSLIKTARYSSDLESVNNVMKTSGNKAPELVSSIHYVESFRTRLSSTAFRDNQFSIITGKYNEGYPDAEYDSFGEDRSARVTRADQGKIIFANNNKTINIQSYPSKTG